jgi:hypothetical protein
MTYHFLILTNWKWSDCVVAHAVSRPLPTAVARVRAQVRLCGIYGGKIGTGIGFLRTLQFPLSIIPPTAAHSIVHHSGLVH